MEFCCRTFEFSLPIGYLHPELLWLEKYLLFNNFKRSQVAAAQVGGARSAEPNVTVFECSIQADLENAFCFGRCPCGKNHLEKTSLFTEAAWCVGNGPLDKITSKNVAATSYLRGKNIPIHELTEFDLDKRYYPLFNKNHMRKLKKSLDEFNLHMRVPAALREKVKHWYSGKHRTQWTAFYSHICFLLQAKKLVEKRRLNELEAVILRSRVTVKHPSIKSCARVTATKSKPVCIWFNLPAMEGSGTQTVSVHRFVKYYHIIFVVKYFLEKKT